jgi:hypothetical protein
LVTAQEQKAYAQFLRSSSGRNTSDSDQSEGIMTIGADALNDTYACSTHFFAFKFPQHSALTPQASLFEPSIFLFS